MNRKTTLIMYIFPPANLLTLVLKADPNEQLLFILPLMPLLQQSFQPIQVKHSNKNVFSAQEYTSQLSPKLCKMFAKAEILN